MIIVDLSDKNFIEVNLLEGGVGPQITSGTMRPEVAGEGELSMAILKHTSCCRGLKAK